MLDDVARKLLAFFLPPKQATHTPGLVWFWSSALIISMRWADACCIALGIVCCDIRCQVQILGIGGSNATQIAGKYNGFVTPACSRESEPAPFAALLKR